jgi:cold shock CspA family protein
MKGTVKWYDRVKGYGFIQTEDEKVITGQLVEFEVEQREKGLVAVKVKKVEE